MTRTPASEIFAYQHWSADGGKAWRQLSVIAGVTWWRFYFRLFAGTVRGPQAVEFLSALRRQVDGPLLVIWDGLAVHRSRVVGQWVERTGGGSPIGQPPLVPSASLYVGIARCAVCIGRK